MTEFTKEELLERYSDNSIYRLFSGDDALSYNLFEGSLNSHKNYYRNIRIKINAEESHNKIEGDENANFILLIKRTFYLSASLVTKYKCENIVEKEIVYEAKYELQKCNSKYSCASSITNLCFAENSIIKIDADLPDFI